MEKKSFIPGIVMIVAILFFVVCVLLAFNAIDHDQQLAGGLFMFSASIPLSIVLYWVLKES